MDGQSPLQEKKMTGCCQLLQIKHSSNVYKCHQMKRCPLTPTQLATGCVNKPQKTTKKKVFIRNM